MSTTIYYDWLHSLTDAELREEFKLRSVERFLFRWSLADLCFQEMKRRGIGQEIVAAIEGTNDKQAT